MKCRPFEAERVLTEISYDITCPRCGPRTQVEKVAGVDRNSSPFS
jgi:hypothetical protein